MLFKKKSWDHKPLNYMYYYIILYYIILYYIGNLNTYIANTSKKFLKSFFVSSKETLSEKESVIP